MEPKAKVIPSWERISDLISNQPYDFKVAAARDYFDSFIATDSAFKEDTKFREYAQTEFIKEHVGEGELGEEVYQGLALVAKGMVNVGRWLGLDDEVSAIQDYIDRDIEPPSGKYAHPPESGWEYLTDPKRLWQLVATNLPLAGVLALPAVGIPLAGGTAAAGMATSAVLYGAVESGGYLESVDDYEKETNKKISPEIKYPMALGVGVLNTALGMTGLGKILKTTGKTAGKKVINSVISGSYEAFTEGMEELVQAAGLSFATGELPEKEELWIRFRDSFAAGAVVGGIMSSANAAFETEGKQALEEEESERVREVLDKQEVEEAEKLAEEVEGEVEEVGREVEEPEEAKEVEEVEKVGEIEGVKEEKEDVTEEAAEEIETVEESKEEEVSPPVVEREKAKKKVKEVVKVEESQEGLKVNPVKARRSGKVLINLDKENWTDDEVAAIWTRKASLILGKKVPPLNSPEIKSYEATTPRAEILKAITKLSGAKRAIFVETPLDNFVAGSYMPEFDAYIFQAKGEAIPTFVVGHEATHRLRVRHPKLYAQLYDVLITEDKAKAYNAWSKRGLKDAAFQRWQNEEEFIADAVGERMSSMAFWEKLHKKSPKLVKTLAENLLQFFKSVKATLKRESLKYFNKSHLGKVVETIDQVMFDYFEIAKPKKREVVKKSVKKKEAKTELDAEIEKASEAKQLTQKRAKLQGIIGRLQVEESKRRLNKKENKELYEALVALGKLKKEIREYSKINQVKLYITPPEPKTVTQKEKLRLADKVNAVYEEGNKLLTEKQRVSKVKRFRALRKTIWDSSGNVEADLKKVFKEEANDVVQLKDLSRGHAGYSEEVYYRAVEDIYSGLSRVEEKLFDRYIGYLNSIMLSKMNPDMKHEGGLTPRDMQAWIDVYLKGDLKKKLDRAVKKHRTWTRKVLYDMYKGGLINKKAYKTLYKREVYSPRTFIQHIDPNNTVNAILNQTYSYEKTGRKITVNDSGLKALEEGSCAAMEKDSRLLLSQVITRAYSRIYKNKANQALLALTQKHKDNGLTSTKVKKGYVDIGVFVDGSPKKVYMLKELANEWVSSDPLMSQLLTGAIGWVTGTKPLKATATAYNIAFAFSNLFRDIAYVFLTTDVFQGRKGGYLRKTNPLTFVRNLSKHYKQTFKDAWKEEGAYLDYAKEGGLMATLTRQGAVKTKLGNRFHDKYLKPLSDGLSQIGNFTEIWTRLAIRDRALELGYSPIEATHIARNMLDFSKGGNVAKYLDLGIPYLNAGIQGTRGITRAAKNKPGEFTAKLIWLGAFTTGLYLANYFQNKEAYDKTSAITKTNYWILPFSLPYKDSKGNRRFLSFRIPKDQGQRLYTTIVEGFVGKALGHEVDVDRVVKAAIEFIPIVPSQMIPPTFEALLGYAANYDFWRSDNVWKGSEVESYLERTPYTNPFFVEAGLLSKKVTSGLGLSGSLSPERLNNALSQVFAYNNPFAAASGITAREILGNIPGYQKEKSVENFLSTFPILNRITYSTSLKTPAREEIRRLEIQENSRRREQNIILDTYINDFVRNKDKQARNEALAFIRDQPFYDRKRLLKRFRDMIKIGDIEDRSFYFDVRRLPPEVRARVMYSQWLERDEEGKRRLLRDSRRVPNLVSKKYLFHFNRLRRLTPK